MSDQDDPTAKLDMWRCRKIVIEGYDAKKGLPNNKVQCELVWGHWVYPREGDGRHTKGPHIAGEVYHSIGGPTAERSIEDFARDLNARKVPPEKAPDFTRARKLKNDPAQLSLLLMMTPKGNKK